MREKPCRPGIGAAWVGLLLVSALLLNACEKQPAVVTPAPQAPAAVVANKIEQPASADAGKAQDARRTAANAALVASVKAVFAAEPGLKGTGIDVVAKDGIVSLFGTVGSASQLITAANVASKVPGVTSVVNKLVVLAGS